MIFHWNPKAGGIPGAVNPMDFFYGCVSVGEIHMTGSQVNGLLISSGYREDHPPENAISSEVWTSGEFGWNRWMDIDGSGRSILATEHHG